MVLLGIDYGTQYIGLALATGPLAEPLTTLRVTPNLLKKLYELCLQLEVKKVIVGISEGQMAQQTREFVRNLEKELSIPVLYQDETLTTHQAIQGLIAAKGKRKLRQGRKDQFAATLILQDYLDRTPKELGQHA